MFRIRDDFPESGSRNRSFPSRIPDPNFFHPGSASKNLGVLAEKMVSKLKEIWSGLFISDLGSGSWLSTHPGSRGQKGTESRIQHTVWIHKQYLANYSEKRLRRIALPVRLRIVWGSVLALCACRQLLQSRQQYTVGIRRTQGETKFTKCEVKLTFTLNERYSRLVWLRQIYND